MATEPSTKTTRKKISALTEAPPIFKVQHTYGTLVRVILPGGTSKLAYCSGVQEGDMACAVSLELPDRMRHTVDSNNVWDYVTYEDTETVSEEEASKHFGSQEVDMPKENWPNPLPTIRHIFRVVSPTT
jgi:hypothetical protein